jgi:Tat protein translocase TatB subunit
LYLLILESIGTAELILIGIIALIVFGPRKLPQMAKTVGKTMADLKRAGQDFRTTWEKEVTLEEEMKFLQDPLDDNLIITETKVTQTTTITESKIPIPEVKEIRQENFPDEIYKSENKHEESTVNSSAVNKHDWL